jgi:thiol-disulfide isomerase/thioredoxin
MTNISMKLLTTTILLILGALMLFSSDRPLIAQATEKVSAEKVLKKVSDKLNGLRSLKYKYQLELNYASEGYKAAFTTDAYLDFTSVDKILGVRYQFKNEDEFFVFNGSEKFELNRKNKTVKIAEKPINENFQRVTYFYNSPVTLRNVLAGVIKDSSIPKSLTETTANDRPTYVVEFVLDKKTFGRLGGYDAMDLNRKTTYRLTIDKASYLPVEVLQKNSANEDFMKTVISDVAVNPVAPDPLSWYYSSYLNEYKRQDDRAPGNKLIAAGTSAPDWNLPVFDTNRLATLSQFKTKVVLVEFWISQCGFCIAAVPKLNLLADKYKGKDFKLIGINAHDSAEIINLFQQANKPRYDLLTSGAETAKAYGVDGFPMFVLIDKTGKVIYSVGFDEQKLDRLIMANIQ